MFGHGADKHKICLGYSCSLLCDGTVLCVTGLLLGTATTLNVELRCVCKIGGICKKRVQGASPYDMEGGYCKPMYFRN